MGKKGLLSKKWTEKGPGIELMRNFNRYFCNNAKTFPSQEMRSTTVQPGGDWLSQCQKIPSFLQDICVFLSLEPTFKSTYTVFGKKYFCVKIGPFHQFGP